MILIVDDDPSRIEWFQETFGEGNIEHTSQVEEALEKIASNEYEAIFLDFNLSNPEASGVDLAIAMQHNQMATETPIVIHSDDNYGIRHMSRILGRYHPDVTACKFDELVQKYADTE